TNTLPAELMELLNQKKSPSILGRVVKALDLSPSGLSPRGFEPRRMHFSAQKSIRGDSETRRGAVNLQASRRSLRSRASVAQWIEHQTSNLGVVGSSPT
ncbi:hypothetical protein G9A89_000529, partial [Geosiphon pyriformis]